MATIPSAVGFLALSGGTVTGALTVAGLLTTQAGITNSGAVIQSSSQIQATGVTNVQAGAQLTAVLGNVDVQTAGSGLKVAEGSNAKQGVTAAMVGGTITVANTSTTASSRIMLTGQTAGGTPGGLNVSARTAGTSFTITSTNAADTSTAGFQMFEPG